MQEAKKNIKLMVVDEDPLLCELMKFNLEQNGFEVDVFRDIPSAYNGNIGSYDMFIIDAMMEDRRGMNFAKYLKQTEITNKTPLIFCSSRDDEMAVINGLDLGADDYVLKPFAMKEMIARINAILRRHGIKRQ